MTGRAADAEPALVNHAPAGHVPTGFDPAREPFWPIRIKSYAPSHRQFRLSEDLTPEQITAALGGIEPKQRESGDGKVTLQWSFWAEQTYKLPNGGFGSTSTCCKIWDYKGARWSAYGWPEAFEQVGLTPFLTQDYGTWTYEEDGNPTLHFLAQGLKAQAIEAQRAMTEGHGPKDESAVRQDAPNPDSRPPITNEQIEAVKEALHNLIVLARPHFSDSVQMLALSQAEAALSTLEVR